MSQSSARASGAPSPSAVASSRTSSRRALFIAYRAVYIARGDPEAAALLWSFMPLAIVFDLDGTLVDSLDDIGASMNEALAKRGIAPHTTATYRALIGDGVRDLAGRAAATTDTGEIEAIVADFAASYATRLCESTAPYAGIAPMLASLGARGVVLGVLSNKPDAATQAIAHTLFPSVFADVRGHIDGEPKKPDPEPLRAQLARLGASPETTLFVGDSEIDVATARSAGVRVVAVGYGYRDAAVLGDADEVVHDVPGLVTAIDTWLVVMGRRSDQDRAP